MKVFLITCLLIAGLLAAGAETGSEEVDGKPEITKVELVDIGEGASDVDGKQSEVQRKRDSGYAYKRPEGFALGSRARFQFGQSGNRGRIVSRPLGQISRPGVKYGPPGYQNSPPTAAGFHSQQHRDKLQLHSYPKQQHSSNLDGRPNGFQEQEVPSPIRQVDFVEPNPISSQNNQPFAPHSANYLPPQNQKLPGYDAGQTFAAAQAQQAQAGPTNFPGQSLVQAQEQISDGALFLSENAHAIQQLYGAPPNEQEFAPHVDPLANPNGQFEQFQSSSQSPQNFPGSLPSYASGTLSARETLEQIQSLEKDRLIVQLQRALASHAQAQSADAAGRYAQNQPSFVQNQDLLASLGQRMKIHGLNAQPSTVNFGPGSEAFNQSPFLPGTTVPPGFPLSYGLTTVAPPSTTTATTTTTTTVQPPQPAKADGTSQAGTSVPVPPLSPPLSPSLSTGVPVYGGFVPTLSFASPVPSYGPNFFAPGAVAPVQPSGSSPTHFGLPIPSNPAQKPSSATTPPTATSSTPSAPLPSKPSAPPSPPLNALPIPVYPIATPLHPVVTPLHPVAPLKPVLPATPTHVQPVQPVQTPSTVHPSYGVQTSLIDSLLYKPVKPVYPFYYYPNVAYQLHKPALPTYPWSYAPTYTQAKPTQIWK